MIPHTLRILPRLLINARLYSTANDVLDVRARLLGGVKLAMKAKDAVASTTLRSVLSEVYAADKQINENVSSATIVGILRKAVARRKEAAAKFSSVHRQDLADKELQEASLLSKLLPPLLSEAEIDATINTIIATLPTNINSRSLLGTIFKEFYQKVDKSVVDASLVKQRASSLIANRL